MVTTVFTHAQCQGREVRIKLSVMSILLKPDVSQNIEWYDFQISFIFSCIYEEKYPLYFSCSLVIFQSESVISPRQLEDLQLHCIGSLLAPNIA